MDRPKLSTAIWLSIVCVVWFAATIIIYFRTAAEWFFIFAMILIWVIIFSAAAVSWWYWSRYENIMLDMDKRRAESITPFTEAANIMMRLTREQLDFLGMRGYHAMVGTIGTKDGPMHVLLTPWGNVPMSIVRKELRRSGLVRLPAIRNYSDGSPEREYLRIIIKWAVDMGLAIDPNGNEPAMWLDKDSRNIAAGMLGIDLYGSSDNDNGNGEEQ